MKRLLILAVLALFAAATLSAQEVGGKIFWDGGTIPDPAFRQYVLDNFDTDHNGQISKTEAEAVTKIELEDKGIKSLRGVEYFTALTELDCESNQLTSLDLSKNTALTKLYCSSNPLTSIDLSNLSKFNWILMDSFMSNKGLRIITNSATNVVWQIEAYRKEQKEYERELKGEAIYAQELQQAREREAAKVKSQQRAAECKRQIVPYLARKDWEGADRLAAEALADMPDGDAYLYFVRAKCYYMRNLDFGSEADENASAFFRAYRQEAQNLVDMCNKSIWRDSSNSNEAYFCRGIAYTILGQANNAASDFRAYMNGNQANKGLCYYNIGVAYKNAEWWKDALDNFKLARQNYTKQTDIDRCMRKIKECQEKLN